MSYRTTACGWEPLHCGETDGGDQVCTSLAGLTPDMQDAVTESAVSYLWQWTGRKFGVCELTVRPCKDTCWEPSTYSGGRRWGATIPWYGGPGYGGLNPALIDGNWYNLPCGGGCHGSCSCTEVETVKLYGPVASIGQVIEDGEVLPDTAYRVDNYTDLVRLDGGHWPVCQPMSAALGETGTFGVTYSVGIAVPAGGRLAAGVLACQIAKWVCKGNVCGPPQNARSVSRQGVSVDMIDLDKMFDRGRTGIPMVDLWLSGESPRGKTGGRVYSPDLHPVRRTTTPGGT